MSPNWQHLHQFIGHHQLNAHPLVVALSGGADSVALLHMFFKLREHNNQSFSAIHVNHGLSENAGQWQSYVTELCQRWDVPLTVCQVNIVKKNRTSLEHQARNARYSAIANELAPNSVLFTGHHQVDQVETFLLRLMRSSGLTGLTAMKPLSSYPLSNIKSKKLQIARPLLDINKQQLLAELSQQQIAWVEDESNSDDAFDRNFVRNKVLPLLSERWPNASQSVSSSIKLLQQEAQLLEEYIEVDYQRCVTHGFMKLSALDINQLKTFSVNKQSVIVRRFIQLMSGVTPTKNALEQILHQACVASVDAQPQVKVGDFWACIHKEQLYIVPDLAQQKCQLETITSIKSDVPVILSQPAVYSTITVHSDSLDFKRLSIQWGHNTHASCATLKPNKNSGSKKVKALLKQAACPPWLRDKVPLMFLDEQLIAVGNLYIDVDWQNQIKITVG
ncbi:MAG: tRNA lysidine(34) synthetase TilS [Gammaproteobacteria bacterium]|nr:tRNA lysidine(34) synthetase TilS [Gammaproteobacteria bacterium]